MNTIDLSAFLASQGYTGQINDSLHQFLQDLGYEGQLNDMFYDFLGDLGYTGTLNERIDQWVNAGYLVPSAPVITGGSLSYEDPNLIIDVPTITGVPSPTVVFTLTRDGADVLGEVVNDTIPNAPDGTYVATWVATNSVGTDTESDSLEVITSSPPAQMGAPTVTTVNQTTLSATLASPPASDKPITSYDLRWSVSGAGSWTVVTGVTSPQSITGLTADTGYEVQTRAVSEDGQGPWSTSGTGTTSPLAPPDPNTAPVVTNVTSTSAQVDWTLPYDGGSPITRSVVQYRVAPSGTIQVVNNAFSPLSLTPLTPGTDYQVRVRSDNAIGGGTLSPFTNFTTEA